MTKSSRKAIEDLSLHEICSRLEKLAERAKRLSEKYGGSEIAAETPADEMTPHS
ncbi:hypothetical protein [Rhizobium sp. BR 314]|uniref:hypothetical protein n=1 Tax=Rhizobium sp. BR 314 TaxID=3040013 RepID=UPI0039BF38AB